MWCHRFKRILVLISHSQDFLNGVCTNIIHMHNRKLKYYTVSKWCPVKNCNCQNQELFPGACLIFYGLFLGKL